MKQIAQRERNNFYNPKYSITYSCNFKDINIIQGEYIPKSNCK